MEMGVESRTIDQATAMPSGMGVVGLVLPSPHQQTGGEETLFFNLTGLVWLMTTTTVTPVGHRK